MECLSIIYNIPNPNHPLHHFHDTFDRVFVEDIIGIKNESITKDDVRETLFYSYSLNKFAFLQLLEGTQIEFIKDLFLVQATVDNAYIYSVKLQDVSNILNLKTPEYFLFIKS